MTTTNHDRFALPGRNHTALFERIATEGAQIARQLPEVALGVLITAGNVRVNVHGYAVLTEQGEALWLALWGVA